MDVHDLTLSAALDLLVVSIAVLLVHGLVVGCSGLRCLVHVRDVLREALRLLSLWNRLSAVVRIVEASIR